MTGTLLNLICKFKLPFFKTFLDLFSFCFLLLLWRPRRVCPLGFRITGAICRICARCIAIRWADESWRSACVESGLGSTSNWPISSALSRDPLTIFAPFYLSYLFSSRCPAQSLSLSLSLTLILTTNAFPMIILHILWLFCLLCVFDF